MCRVLGVSTSGYYAWLKRPRCKRATEDDNLQKTIIEIHANSDGTYGAPRVLAELKDDYDTSCGQKRIARLMRLAGIQGCHRRRRRSFTKKNPHQAPAKDLVKRDFTATRPAELAVADITYVPTGQGFIFLAVVMDCFTRMIVGWSIRNDLSARLVIDAFQMARHRGKLHPGSIHHSDQGAQYTSIDFGLALKASGILASMGSAGSCFDNAMAESFFATLECELIDRYRFATKAEGRSAVFRFIEGFYNPRRRHSRLNNLSPMNFERRWETEHAS